MENELEDAGEIDIKFISVKLSDVDDVHELMHEARRILENETYHTNNDTIVGSIIDLVPEGYAKVPIACIDSDLITNDLAVFGEPRYAFDKYGENKNVPNVVESYTQLILSSGQPDECTCGESQACNSCGGK